MAENLLHCLGCDIRARSCAGACPCPVDGKSIREHAAWNLCPHPGGPRFGDGVAPPGWDEVAKVSDVPITLATPVNAAPVNATPVNATPAVCGFADEGRKLWKELHGRELVDALAELHWLVFEFRPRIWCNECREHWDEMLVRTPPDLVDAAAYFRWGVDRHNEVNRRLGKPEMSYAAAAELWLAGGRQDRTADEAASIDM